jgi:hypothetical protein
MVGSGEKRRPLVSLTVAKAVGVGGGHRPDVRPPSRPLAANIKEKISGILTAWGMR